LLLAAAAAEPGTRLAALPLLSPPERQQLLQEWSGRATAYPRESTIHDLFSQQASERPDAVALVSAELTLSYAELARRVFRLARRLAGLGVGIDVRVGICLDRSVERVMATLAVLAAGGAYVPLDPAQPRERLEILARD